MRREGVDSGESIVVVEADVSALLMPIHVLAQSPPYHELDMRRRHHRYGRMSEGAMKELLAEPAAVEAAAAATAASGGVARSRKIRPMQKLARRGGRCPIQRLSVVSIAACTS